MRRATKTTASLLGAFAGFGGPEHGIFEIMQGHVRPDGLLITSMGPPCDPVQVWHGCEPAMTVVPSFLVMGSWRSSSASPPWSGRVSSSSGGGEGSF